MIGASVSEPLPSDPNVNFVCVYVFIIIIIIIMFAPQKGAEKYN